MPPFDFNNYAMDPSMMGGLDMAGYQAMSKLGQSLPRLNPERYADNYLQRSAVRQAFQGPGVRAGGVHPLRSTGGGMLSQIFSGGMPSDNPDVSALNVQLSPYGLSEGHINPFLFFQDQNTDGSPTWAGNHPKVAKAIEGAMLGAANTGSGNTIGENIANVARSVMSVPAAYRQNQAAQLQAPFDQASMLMKLQDDQSNRELKLAQAFHLRATGQAAMDKPTKSFSGQVYQDAKNRPYEINQVDGSTRALDGSDTPLELSGSTKVGTPAKPTTSNGVPKGINPGSAAGKAWVKWSQEPGFDGTFPSNWGARVDAETARTAAAGGYGGEAAKKKAAQESGALSDTDKANIADLQKQRDEAFAHYKEKLTPSDVRSRPEDGTTARLQAERAERKAALDKAEAALKAANSKATQGVAPSGARTGGATGNRPKVIIEGNKVTIQ